MRRELKAAGLYAEENAVTISLTRYGDDGMEIDGTGGGGGGAAGGGGGPGAKSNLIEGAIVGPDMERKRKRPGRKRKKPLPGEEDKGKTAGGAAVAVAAGDANKKTTNPTTGTVDGPNAKKAKTDSSAAAAAAAAAPTPAPAPTKPPPPKPKTAKEVLRRILRKYPEIIDDPVYVAALRNVGLDVPSLQEMQQLLVRQRMAAAAARSDDRAKKNTGNAAAQSKEAGKDTKAKKKISGDKPKAPVVVEDAQTRMKREARELMLAVGEVA